jgi:hypothetical protein
MVIGPVAELVDLVSAASYLVLGESTDGSSLGRVGLGGIGRRLIVVDFGLRHFNS